MVCRPDCRAIGGKWGFLVTSDPYQAYPAFPAGAPYRFVEDPAVELVAVADANKVQGNVLSSDPYQANPDIPSGAPVPFAGPSAVELIAAGPANQRRLTVAFRLILVIPHILALFFLGVAGAVVVFLGWWAALCTGRLPAFAVGYLSGLARWSARASGYTYLLTDVYPPFTLDDDPAYPVVIAIPEPQRLNRLAVLFRFIMSLWAFLVVTVAGSGANSIVAVIAWAMTLITGKMPTSLHLALTALLRYQTRYYCYLAQLTPAYPWQLFGDQPEPVFEPTSRPADWRLVLSRPAKNLLIVFIALGLISAAGAGFWVLFAATTDSNIAQWGTAAKTLDTEMIGWSKADDTCATNGNLTCLSSLSEEAAGYLDGFIAQVSELTLPSAAAADETSLLAIADESQSDFETISLATTIDQYQGDFASTNLQQDLTSLMTDLASVASTLRKSQLG
jgi:Domain of unknown function (DUF4389)